MTTITPAWCQHGPVHVAPHPRSHCPWTWGTMDVMVAKMIPRLQEAPCSHRTKVGWSMWQFPKITELLDMGNHGSHGSRHIPQVLPAPVSPTWAAPCGSPLMYTRSPGGNRQMTWTTEAQGAVIRNQPASSVGSSTFL